MRKLVILVALLGGFGTALLSAAPAQAMMADGNGACPAGTWPDGAGGCCDSGGGLGYINGNGNGNNGGSGRAMKCWICGRDLFEQDMFECNMTFIGGYTCRSWGKNYNGQSGNLFCTIAGECWS